MGTGHSPMAMCWLKSLFAVAGAMLYESTVLGVHFGDSFEIGLLIFMSLARTL